MRTEQLLDDFRLEHQILVAQTVCQFFGSGRGKENQG
jgi:hypothetical protein